MRFLKNLNINCNVKQLSGIVALIFLMLASSCKKQQNAASGSANTFIRTILHNTSLYTVNSFMLSDGNYMILGKDPSNTNPGIMLKMDINGNILWQKNLSDSITVLWKAMSIGSKGFIAAGFDANPKNNQINIITYDNNGSFISASTLLPGKGSSAYSLDIIQLNNGGFAVSGSVLSDNNYPIPFLIITDVKFSPLYLKVYSPLNNEYNYAVTGLAESADGTIDIAGYFNVYSGDNPFLIKAYPNAVQQSFTYLKDSSVFSTPGCINLTSSGNILLPVASANISSDQGELVNYKNTTLKVVSGTLGINELDANGNFTGMVQYSGYANNGLINSMKCTADGGYILCGTVNQLNAVDFSNTEIFVMKVDASLNEQWSNTYDTDYPSFGVDAFQTKDGGYLISGYHLSYSKNYNMVLIKTDGSGNVNQANN
jgi:hypothetical protein